MTPWERAVRAHRLINDEAHGNDPTVCESEACEFIVEEIEAAVKDERKACAAIADENRGSQIAPLILARGRS